MTRREILPMDGIEKARSSYRELGQGRNLHRHRVELKSSDPQWLLNGRGRSATGAIDQDDRERPTSSGVV